MSSQKKFDFKRLQPMSLDISTIKVTCATWHSTRNHRLGGYIVFDGIYQHGSAGSEDARFIRWSLHQFLELHRVDACVIDCMSLAYDWGDDLSFSLQRYLGEKEVPKLVVCQSSQRDAYVYAIDETCLRHDVGQALAETNALLIDMKSRL